VYGTSNLRVADLSILPLQVAAHTICTSRQIVSFSLLMSEVPAVVYGVAEKGRALPCCCDYLLIHIFSGGHYQGCYMRNCLFWSLHMYAQPSISDALLFAQM
jgi:hypothetical protein